MSPPPPPEVVAAIAAAIAAHEARRPQDLALRVVPAAPAAPGPSPWALAGRLQQMRGLGTRR